MADFAHSNQSGVVLIMALVFLTILSLLGFSVMSVSHLELKMAGHAMTMATALNQAESCLKAAESDATRLTDNTLNNPSATLTADGGYYDIAAGVEVPDVGDPDFWLDPDVSWSCPGGGRYVIEYLGLQAIVRNADRYTGTAVPMHGFRISARGGETEGGGIILQSMFYRNAL
jgi:type IV pilus assembly protein PilX